MEKDRSSWGKEWVSEEIKENHVERQADEMGLTHEEYLVGATSVANSTERGVKAFVDAVGSTHQYNPNTNEYTVTNNQGKLVTYFYPSNGLNYFYRQFELYDVKKYSQIKENRMGKIIKNERTGRMVEQPPYQCKLCGMSEIRHLFDMCHVCGWQDDGVQYNDPNYEGGANRLSFNQYKSVWEKNKQKIIDNKTVGTKSRLIEEIHYKTHPNKTASKED